MTNSKTRDNQRSLNLVLTMSVLALVTMANVGCANLGSMRAKQGDLDAAVAGESKGESSGTYIVEVHPTLGQPKIFKGETSELNSIETAIESSFAKKFRNMEIELYRKDSVTGRIIKMTSVYDPKQHFVTPETDYTIHAGDRVVIRQKSNSLFDKASSKIFGEF